MRCALVRGSPGVFPVKRKENAAGAKGKGYEVTHLTSSIKRRKPMLRKVGKTLGGAIAVLCLVSTLAVAGEMTCAKDDGKGVCIAATGPDGKTVVVVGEGVKMGEKMDCTDRGNMIECKAMTMKK
jgi:hypothetical protein